MALATGTVYEMRATATTGNTNGAGFNPGNANFPTDLAATSATGNSPVVSSSTYTFVAGDVSSWVYIKSGTNWTPGWYQIASVSAGAATLSAAIGQAIQINQAGGSVLAAGIWGTNTVAGCATTGSPTAGTFGVDYSQQDSAWVTKTDFASTGSSTSMTSATAAFTPVSVGNFFHLTAAGTGSFGVVGWYEIVSYTNATTVVTDRTTNSGTAMVAGTGSIGGAGRWNALESTFHSQIPAGGQVWTKSGSYTISGASSGVNSNTTAANPANIIGYTTLRGDACAGTNRPLFLCGANNLTPPAGTNLFNLAYTGTANPSFNLRNAGMAVNCLVTNTTSTANRVAWTCGSNVRLIGCEGTSQNGPAVSTGGPAYFQGCYFHDSQYGITCGAASLVVVDCLITSNFLDGINYSFTGGGVFVNNTIYGAQIPVGNGINFSVTGNSYNAAVGNIFYGLATGITVSTAEQDSNFSAWNSFFNNTADTSKWQKGATDLALDPQFTAASQLTGTTATSATTVLTDSGANFSTVTDNVSYLHVTAGTGVTTGVYLITSHTTTTLTVNNTLGTGSSVVYYVSAGTNFGIGTNLKAKSFPGAFGSSSTTGYIDVGAVQRQETGGATTVAYTFS